MPDKRLATLANFSKPYSLLWDTVWPKNLCKSFQTLPTYFDVTPKDESNDERYRPQLLLRTGPKVKMKIVFTNKERVLKSLFYLCNKLWAKLDSTVQRAKSVTEFRNILNKMDLSEL